MVSDKLIERELRRNKESSIVVFLVPAKYSGYNVSQSRQGVKGFCAPGRKGYNRILYEAVAKLVKRGEFYP